MGSARDERVRARRRGVSLSSSSSRELCAHMLEPGALALAHSPPPHTPRTPQHSRSLCSAADVEEKPMPARPTGRRASARAAESMLLFFCDRSWAIGERPRGSRRAFDGRGGEVGGDVAFCVRRGAKCARVREWVRALLFSRVRCVVRACVATRPRRFLAAAAKARARRADLCSCSLNCAVCQRAHDQARNTPSTHTSAFARAHLWPSLCPLALLVETRGPGATQQQAEPALLGVARP